jgi:hypothetical protein
MYHPLCHTTFTVFSIIIVVTSTIRSGWAMRQRAVQQPQQQASDSDDSPPPKLPLSSPFAGRVSEYAPPQQKGKGKEGESSTSPLLLHQHQSQPAAQLGDGDGGVSCPCEMLGKKI